MKTFDEAYRQLNAAQKKAVETIEGPVMVVAGPGTGKTQLLSMRAANILRLTDTLPGNILCLTFTESAAMAMRQRLLSLIGPGAHRIAIHTFHSFGTEIINNYPASFYQGARFQPADELSTFEVLEPLFAALDHKNPLATTMNGEFTALHDARQAIGYLKKAGLSPDDLLAALDHNEAFIAYAEPILAKVFDVPRLTIKQLPACHKVLETLKKFTPTPAPLALFTPLSELCVSELAHALEYAEEQASTKPLTAWRERWLERDHTRAYIVKDRARALKLRALAEVYRTYQQAMNERELFDFDDMIMRVLDALQAAPELRYNLQERYQYIMVDEFQDTNGAQLRLVQQLLDNPVHEGRPNIMVVGDDDQAIYAFQGAELSNILQFEALYREPVIVTLTENYRSTQTILKSARAVIVQGSERLENTLANIDKTLNAHHRATTTTAELNVVENPAAQHQWIADQIRMKLKAGEPPESIAIIGRTHRHLLAVLPALQQAAIPIDYERRNNVLEAPHIVALILLARVVVALGEQRFDIVESLLPELLSYEFWGLASSDIWQLSLNAYKQRRLWLELMLKDKHKLRAIAEFLIVASHQAQHETCEIMLDFLIGSNELQVPAQEDDDAAARQQTGPSEGYLCPFRAHYFNATRLEQSPNEYLTMLGNLKTIRNALRTYRPDQPLTLADFVGFIELHQKTKIPIVDSADQQTNPHAVQVLTAHKAKGLEFDTVFVLDAQEKVWGPSARRRHSSLRFVHNLPIEPAGQQADDALRLFFVAMTRARTQLILCGYRHDETGRESVQPAFLNEDIITTHHHDTRAVAPERLAPRAPLIHSDMRTLLTPQLTNYQLSATHLNNFIDLSTGGPQAFLLQNLLRFPQAMSRSAVFGSVIHRVLQRAHTHLSSSGQRRPTEDILHDYEIHLQNARLSERDFMHLFEKGSDILEAYLRLRYDSFMPEQKAEYSFISQGVTIGDARLTGAIDLLEIDEKTKTITVIDYKTGKAAKNWQGGSDYEKIKLHKYRQQLMMYKLLVENSRDFGNKYTVRRGVLEFIEPNRAKQIQQLEMDFDEAELTQFIRLLQAVWQHITTLDLPDTSTYPATYAGVLEFEEYLLRA